MRRQRIASSAVTEPYRQKRGYEPLEHAIRRALSIDRSGPLPPNRRAEVLQVLVAVRLAKEHRKWPVRAYVSRGIRFVHVRDFSEWIQNQNFDARNDRIAESRLNKATAAAIATLENAEEYETSVTNIAEHIIDAFLDETGDDLELGAQRRAQMADFAQRAHKLRDNREAEHERWRKEADRLSEQNPHLRSKRQTAKAVQKSLGLRESIETIRKRI